MYCGESVDVANMSPIYFLLFFLKGPSSSGIPGPSSAIPPPSFKLPPNVELPPPGFELPLPSFELPPPSFELPGTSFELTGATFELLGTSLGADLESEKCVYDKYICIAIYVFLKIM